MPSVTIGVFGSHGESRMKIAAALAKKGTVEDFSQYQTKYMGKIVTVLEPTSFPEKISPMVFCAYLSDYCILIADELNARLGEIIVALDLLGKEKGCIIASVEVENLIKNTVLEKYGIFNSFEEAKEKILGFTSEREKGEGVFASVDHSFEVKGVGSILLGFLHSGTISQHDRLRVLPNGKELEVRSIQMHDEDVKSTNAGDRFGLAIKLLTSKDVERGDFLIKNGPEMATSKEIEVHLKMSKFSKESLKKSEQIHAIHFLADAPCKWVGEEVSSGGREKGKLIFDKSFSMHKGFPLILVRLNERGLRVIGKATL